MRDLPHFHCINGNTVRTKSLDRIRHPKTNAYYYPKRTSHYTINYHHENTGYRISIIKIYNKSKNKLPTTPVEQRAKK